MQNKGSESFIYTKERTFKSLSFALFLYRKLSQIQQDKFLDALNKNPIRNIIESDCFKISQIYNYEAFEKYFIYLPNNGEKGLYFIKKEDVDKVINNLKFCIENSWKTDKNYLMN